METCEEAGGASTSAALMPSPMTENSNSVDGIAFGDVKVTDIDPGIPGDERDFYLKSYPTFSRVRDKKVHCTVCRVHMGTAPNQLEYMKMHPILRVTHCNKCHDFYNSGEFSKGEDGSELYCRWCGQGGEVFCCSSCPYVFCKTCISKNLPRSVIDEIETNENWLCFSCNPKVLWTLRAQHWALMNYIADQQKEIDDLNLTPEEYMQRISRDSSTCCRLAKAKCGNMSDSLESIESQNSRRSTSAAGPLSSKKLKRPPSQLAEPSKRLKRSNDEVVCTPDLISMLEPDCQLTVSMKSQSGNAPGHSTPKIMSIQTNFSGGAAAAGGQQTKAQSTPPPLVLRNTGVQMRAVTPQNIALRTVARPPATQTPVYHTINGYRIDLNTAARQETFRLPNGKLIQVKRQGANNATTAPSTTAPTSSAHRSFTINPPVTYAGNPAKGQIRNVTVQQRTPVAAKPNHTVVSTTFHPQSTAGRFQKKTTVVGNTTVTSLGPNGVSAPVPVRVVGQNGTTVVHAQPPPASQNISTPTRQVMVRHVFANTPIGKARTHLQDKVFNAMEISQHLTNKIHTLTHSNAYKHARTYLEVKELYIHLSYLLTYSIGRFNGLQDRCYTDMREFGFGTDANSLQNGQLAAGADYARYGLHEDDDEDDLDVCDFAEQIYKYRQKIYDDKEKLHEEQAEGDGNANADTTLTAPLSPFVPLKDLNECNEVDEETAVDQDDAFMFPVQEIKEEPPEILDYTEEEAENAEMPEEDDSYPYEEEQLPETTYEDDDDGDEYSAPPWEPPEDDDELSLLMATNAPASTEENLNRGEENHAYDRKLTRLMSQYPSIWCTKHNDYGNFEVTRKQWRTISAHFDRTDNVKLRWKNIRKRYVRIEQRIKEGKRFHGYFDKATNFLANRDLPPGEWLPVDCGEDDGDVYERSHLDRIEDELHGTVVRRGGDSEQPAEMQQPINLLPIDVKIINFVKSNPILWRKSQDSISAKVDEQTRRTLWLHLWKSMPTYKCEEIIGRWQHLYEMYKTFRLKTIKDKAVQSNLELKYAKYLAKLFFLYKINEADLDNEGVVLEDFCLTDDELETQLGSRLRDQPDDCEFLRALAREVHKYPQLWNKTHIDYYDLVGRDQIWQNIAENLSDFKHKQASDDEDIEIVEPKTDTINLDSDDESNAKQPQTVKQFVKRQIVKPQICTITINSAEGTLSKIIATDEKKAQPDVDFAANLLEVNLNEGDEDNGGGAPRLVSPCGSAHSSDSGVSRGHPRKKHTNKPNPTLVKQKELLELKKLEELKRNDTKLKMSCEVPLQKVEEEFPYAKELLNDSAGDESDERSPEAINEEEDKKSGDSAETVRPSLDLSEQEKNVTETEVKEKEMPLEAPEQSQQKEDEVMEDKSKIENEVIPIPTKTSESESSNENEAVKIDASKPCENSQEKLNVDLELLEIQAETNTQEAAEAMELDKPEIVIPSVEKEADKGTDLPEVESTESQDTEKSKEGQKPESIIATVDKDCDRALNGMEVQPSEAEIAGTSKPCENETVNVAVELMEVDDDQNIENQSTLVENECGQDEKAMEVEETVENVSDEAVVLEKPVQNEFDEVEKPMVLEKPVQNPIDEVEKEVLEKPVQNEYDAAQKIMEMKKTVENVSDESEIAMEVEKTVENASDEAEKAMVLEKPVQNEFDEAEKKMVMEKTIDNVSDEAEKAMVVEEPVEKESHQMEKAVEVAKPEVICETIQYECENAEKGVHIETIETDGEDKKKTDIGDHVKEVQLDPIEQGASVEDNLYNIVEKSSEPTESTTEIVTCDKTDKLIISNSEQSTTETELIYPTLEHEHNTTTPTKDETDETATKSLNTTEILEEIQPEKTIVQPIPSNSIDEKDPSEGGAMHSIDETEPGTGAVETLAADNEKAQVYEVLADEFNAMT